MSPSSIRAVLRGATEQGMLEGWNGPHIAVEGEGDAYTICTSLTARDVPEHEAIQYCEMLLYAGVEPNYRDSDPF